MAVSMAGLKGNENIDFSDVCRHYLGRWAEILSVIFSLFALLSGAVVYWVLMSNFLFHTVTFIHGLSPFGSHIYYTARAAAGSAQSTTARMPISAACFINFPD